MQEKINGGRVRLTQITTEEGNIRKNLQEQTNARETRIDETRLQLDELKGQMEGSSVSLAPTGGL